RGVCEKLGFQDRRVRCGQERVRDVSRNKYGRRRAQQALFRWKRRQQRPAVYQRELPRWVPVTYHAPPFGHVTTGRPQKLDSSLIHPFSAPNASRPASRESTIKVARPVFAQVAWIW